MKLPLFYPLLDTALLKRAGIPVIVAAEAVLEAGTQILQLRHKGLFSGRLFAEAQAIATLSKSAGAVFVINDRADIAGLLNVGLHLGQQDLHPRIAREITPDAAIGLSTHNEAQLRAAASEPIDYLALGPVFATTSKQDPDPVLGLTEFRRLRPITDRPLVAIGGITLSTAVSVFEAGADSVAVMSGLFAERKGRQGFRSRAREWMRLLS